MVVSSESAWTRALVGLDLATAHLQGNRPDVEQAMALGTTAIEAAWDAPDSLGPPARWRTAATSWCLAWRGRGAGVCGAAAFLGVESSRGPARGERDDLARSSGTCF